jgi:hypothetical protein
VEAAYIKAEALDLLVTACSLRETERQHYGDPCDGESPATEVSRVERTCAREIHILIGLALAVTGVSIVLPLGFAQAASRHQEIKRFGLNVSSFHDVIYLPKPTDGTTTTSNLQWMYWPTTTVNTTTNIASRSI